MSVCSNNITTFCSPDMSRCKPLPDDSVLKEQNIDAHILSEHKRNQRSPRKTRIWAELYVRFHSTRVDLHQSRVGRFLKRNKRFFSSNNVLGPTHFNSISIKAEKTRVHAELDFTLVKRLLECKGMLEQITEGPFQGSHTELLTKLQEFFRISPGFKSKSLGIWTFSWHPIHFFEILNQCFQPEGKNIPFHTSHKNKVLLFVANHKTETEHSPSMKTRTENEFPGSFWIVQVFQDMWEPCISHQPPNNTRPNGERNWKHKSDDFSPNSPRINKKEMNCPKICWVSLQKNLPWENCYLYTLITEYHSFRTHFYVPGSSGQFSFPFILGNGNQMLKNKQVKLFDRNQLQWLQCTKRQKQISFSVR